MVDIEALKIEMFRKGYTQSTLAKRIGISSRTIYSRFKNGKFRLNEIEAIKDALEINNPMPIFFAVKVSDKSQGASV